MVSWNVAWSFLFYVPALKSILVARAVCPASASDVSWAVLPQRPVLVRARCLTCRRCISTHALRVVPSSCALRRFGRTRWGRFRWMIVSKWFGTVYSKPIQNLRQHFSNRSLSFQDSFGGHNNLSCDAIVCFGERITAFPWLLVIVYIAGWIIAFFRLYNNSWWSENVSMQVSSDDYEIEGIWCGFVHGTYCTSTRVSEKCLNLEVEQTVELSIPWKRAKK